jgi:hypothetical protein
MMLRKRILTMAVGAVALVALSSGPAAARSTVTMTCTSGLVVVIDANATQGLTAAIAIYNERNPGGDVCSLS